jgi:hypothetical protein
LLGQDAGAEGTVSANVDAPEEDDEGHSRIMKKKVRARYRKLMLAM